MKTLVLVAFLLAIAISASALPTYISNTDQYLAGTYVGTIPIWFDDETGNQLFDGDYGCTDWLDLEPQTEQQYWDDYATHNGYANPYVAWYSDNKTEALITFDMNRPFMFSQIGVHGFQRTVSGAIMPSTISISFSNDNVIFSAPLNLVCAGDVVEGALIWKTISFTETESRFVRISMEIHDIRQGVPNRYWIDEISINGMDGAQFAASVPEPSSLIVLGTLLVPLLAFRRRR